MPREFLISSRSCYESGIPGTVFRCAFHPSEPVLACAIEGGRVCVYESSCIVPFSQWQETILRPATQYPAQCLEWNANGTRLAAGCANGTVILWSRDGRLLFERRKHTSFICNIGWNPIELNVFATGSNDRSAIVWDADRKPSPLVQRFVAHEGDRIHDVVWISGNQFASFSRDQQDGIIHICQIGRETPITTLLHGDSIDSLRWNSKLKLLVSISSCSRDPVQVWSPNQSEPIKRFNLAQSEVGCVDWCSRIINSEEDNWIVGGCADGCLCLWNLNDPSRHETIDGHRFDIMEISFSPNGIFLASIDTNGNTIIRLTKDWRKLYETRTQPTEWKKSLSWNASSDKLAIVTISNEVFVVEIVD